MENVGFRPRLRHRPKELQITNPPTPIIGSKTERLICALRGCSQLAYVNELGVHGKYCSLLHKRNGELQERCCLFCLSAPIKRGHFCRKSCAVRTHDLAPCLLPIPTSHGTFKDVRCQFKKSWRHTEKKCPHVRAVYKIICSKTSNGDYDSYRALVESQHNFSANGRSAGNEKRRWHGTVRDCTLGEAGNITLCTSQTCSLCGVIRTSFDIAFFGRKTRWGRFGCGIYTSSTSSKSDDYSQNSGNIQSNWKALLLNKVVVGRGHKVTQNDTTLTGPPAGFNSVLAEPGGDLNYDELVVYDNRAIKPSYLVMYEF